MHRTEDKHVETAAVGSPRDSQVGGGQVLS